MNSCYVTLYVCNDSVSPSWWVKRVCYGRYDEDLSCPLSLSRFSFTALLIMYSLSCPISVRRRSKVTSVVLSSIPSWRYLPPACEGEGGGRGGGKEGERREEERDGEGRNREREKRRNW